MKRNPGWGQGSGIVLFFLLSLLPVLLVNGGWGVLQARAKPWEEERRLRKADATLDGMARSWEIQTGCRLAGERLLARIETGLAKGGASTAWAGRLAETAGKTFPGAECWLFQVSGASSPAGVEVLGSPPQARAGRRPMALAFQDLRRRHAGLPRSESEERQATKIMQTLWGKHLRPPLLALSRRGTPTRAGYRGRVWWLTWDYLGSPGGTDLGFILLVPDSKACQIRAMQLARRGWTGDPIPLGGFLQVVPGPIGDVLPPALRRSPRFRAWLKSWRDPRQPLLCELEDFAGPRWRRTIGRFSLFVRPLPHSPHLAFVLLPRPADPPLPVILQWGNALFVLGWGCLLVAGLLGRDPPGVSLRWRFLGMYGLATGMFFLLGGVVGMAFLQESHEGALRRARDGLLAELNRIDDRKEEMRVAYVAACNRLHRDPEILRALREQGVGHPALRARSRQLFQAGGQDLPLLGLFFFSLDGQATATVSPGLSRLDEGGLVRYYRSVVIALLREDFQSRTGRPFPGPNPNSAEDEALLRGHANLSSRASATAEAAERRGQAEFYAGQEDTVGKIHDLIDLGREGRIGLLCFWQASDMEQPIFASVREAFLRAHPGERFQVFRHSRGRMDPFFADPSPSPGIGAILARGRYGLAEYADASARRLVLAFPSRSYDRVVFCASVSTAAVWQRRNRLLWSGIAAGCLGGLVFLVVGRVVWQRIGPPVSQVRQAMRAVAAGDLSPRVSLLREDEFGLLTRTFDHMIAGLEIRRRYARLIPGPALETLVVSGGEGGGASLPPPRRVRVVALVSDIRGFTTLCERHPAPVITGLLNAHFTLMAGIIETHGGRVDRFIGDAVQAVFESPWARDGRNPVQAAIDMLRALQDLNRQRVGQGDFPYRIGVGLAMGEVVMGYVGDPDRRFDLALLGPPVQRAADLEAASRLVPWFPLVMDEGVATWARELGYSSGELPEAGPLPCGSPQASVSGGPLRAFVFPRPGTWDNGGQT